MGISSQNTRGVWIQKSWLLDWMKDCLQFILWINLIATICSSAVCFGASLQLCCLFFFSAKLLSCQHIPATYIITSGFVIHWHYISISERWWEAMWKRLTTDLYLHRQVFCPFLCVPWIFNMMFLSKLNFPDTLPLISFS